MVKRFYNKQYLSIEKIIALAYLALRGRWPVLGHPPRGELYEVLGFATPDFGRDIAGHPSVGDERPELSDQIGSSLGACLRGVQDNSNAPSGRKPTTSSRNPGSR
jgi:hypothetical protein